MKINRLRTFLVVAVAVTAQGAHATPSSASAGAPPAYAAYDVAVDGTYEYRATESGLEIMQATRTLDATWHSRGSRPLLITRAANRDTGVVPMSSETTFTGTYEEVVQADPPVIQSCVLSQDKPGGTGLLGAKTDSTGSVSLDIQPLDHLSGTQVCSLPVSDPGIAILGRDLSAKLTFSADRIGDDTIVLPAASTATLPCPSYAYTVTCEASWTGSVTLTRVPVPTDDDISDLVVPLLDLPSTSVGGAPRPVPVPAPSPAGTPIGTKPAQAHDDLTEFVVPLIGIEFTDAEIAALIEPLVRPGKGDRAPRVSEVRDMRFDPAQVKLWFRAACGGGCEGTVRLAAGGTTAHAGRVVASAARAPRGSSDKAQSFRVERGEQVVGLRLGGPIRAALSRVNAAAIVLEVKDRRSHARVRRLVRLHRS